MGNSSSRSGAPNTPGQPVVVVKTSLGASSAPKVHTDTVQSSSASSSVSSPPPPPPPLVSPGDVAVSVVGERGESGGSGSGSGSDSGSGSGGNDASQPIDELIIDPQILAEIKKGLALPPKIVGKIDNRVSLFIRSANYDLFDLVDPGKASYICDVINAIIKSSRNLRNLSVEQQDSARGLILSKIIDSVRSWAFGDCCDVSDDFRIFVSSITSQFLDLCKLTDKVRGKRVKSVLKGMAAARGGGSCSRSAPVVEREMKTRGASNPLPVRDHTKHLVNAMLQQRLASATTQIEAEHIKQQDVHRRRIVALEEEGQRTSRQLTAARAEVDSLRQDFVRNVEEAKRKAYNEGFEAARAQHAVSVPVVPALSASAPGPLQESSHAKNPAVNPGRAPSQNPVLNHAVGQQPNRAQRRSGKHQKHLHHHQPQHQHDKPAVVVTSGVLDVDS